MAVDVTRDVRAARLPTPDMAATHTAAQVRRVACPTCLLGMSSSILGRSIAAPTAETLLG